MATELVTSTCMSTCHVNLLRQLVCELVMSTCYVNLIRQRMSAYYAKLPCQLFMSTCYANLQHSVIIRESKTNPTRVL